MKGHTNPNFNINKTFTNYKKGHTHCYTQNRSRPDRPSNFSMAYFILEIKTKNLSLLISYTSFSQTEHGCLNFYQITTSLAAKPLLRLLSHPYMTIRTQIYEYMHSSKPVQNEMPEGKSKDIQILNNECTHS